jgi:hypothetical protein
MDTIYSISRSWWPRGLRRGSAAAYLLGLWVRIPPEAWMFVFRECCVLSGRGLCDGLITRPEESYRVWCVWVWSSSPDKQDSLDHWGCRTIGKICIYFPCFDTNIHIVPAHCTDSMYFVIFRVVVPHFVKILCKRTLILPLIKEALSFKIRSNVLTTCLMFIIH